MKKKPKLNAAQRQLQADFEALMAKHSKPLERGAKAKSVAGVAPPISRRGTPLLESTRLNKEASVDTGYSSTAPRQQILYSGDKVLGVALMHKSSYAPVFSKDGALDISRMKK
jgi:hypothetical protein